MGLGIAKMMKKVKKVKKKKRATNDLDLEEPQVILSLAQESSLTLAAKKKVLKKIRKG